MAHKNQSSELKLSLKQFTQTMNSMKIAEDDAIIVIDRVQLQLGDAMAALNLAASQLEKTGNHSAADAVWASVESLQKEKAFLYKIRNLFEERS